MPAAPLIEKHFTAAVREVVIGKPDCLTAPFALAAGLAEVPAGAIAIGRGGYLAARTDIAHFASEMADEDTEIEKMRDREIQVVEGILRGYGFEGAPLNTFVGAIAADRIRWIEFMMRFGLGLVPLDNAGSAVRLARHEHRNRCVSQNLLGNAAQDEGFDSAAPMRAHHDQIAAFRGGGVKDRLER
jgi:VIT family